MGKKFKRNRKIHLTDEVSEFPYKAFEEKVKERGLEKYFIRIKRKRKP